MADDFLCPSREGNASWPGRDKWQTQPNGDRTCSYCGSLHPDDFASIIEAYGKGEPGYRFDTTSKSYKRYASRPGVQNASQGGIKFYTWHLPEGDALDRLHKLHATAFERFRAEMEALTSPKH